MSYEDLKMKLQGQTVTKGDVSLPDTLCCKAAEAITTLEAERDRLREAVDAGIDALTHALFLLPADCNQRLGMEGALRAMQETRQALGGTHD